MSKNQHLLPRNGIWYYCRRVPKAFQAEHGTMIQHSLGTSDKKEAIKWCELFDVEWRQRFEGKVTLRATDCTEAYVRKPLAEVQAGRLAQDFVARWTPSVGRIRKASRFTLRRHATNSSTS